MFRRVIFAAVSAALLSACAGQPRLNPVSPDIIKLINTETNRCGEGD